MTKSLLHIIITSFFLLIIGSCANVSAPTGGPKDKTPPQIMEQVPVTGTTNFTDKKIRIWFDEFVSVKDLNTEFISSPPLKKPPKFIMRGKSVEFTIADTLKENTTYHLNFGNAIVDVNESNPYANLNIAFSTGNQIDSLQIKGQLYDAFNLKPVENVLMLLYDTEIFHDSIPYKTIPSFIAKTNTNGEFEITYLKSGNYKLFALEDLNKNRIFDQPNERIAFLDSILNPKIFEEFITDTIFANDTLANDSIFEYSNYSYTPDSLSFYLFEEENYKQFIKKTLREEREILKILMNDSLTKETNLTGLNFDINKCYTEFSGNKDSILIFIEDSSIYKEDTLLLEFSYQMLDTLYNLTDYTDTIKFIYKEKRKPKKRKKDEITEKPKKLIDIKFNVKNGSRKDLNTGLYFILSHPITNIDKDKFKLETRLDTSYIDVHFNFKRDSVNKRKYYIDFDLKENTEYKLFIDTNTFYNNFSLTNDTIIHRFTSQELSYYGAINATLTNVNQQVIIQLIKDEGKVLQEYIVNNNSTVNFPYIKAGEYSLKLIFDNNKNRKWDTGKYLDNIQPEKIIYYKDVIKVKSNWDMDINWDL